MDFVSNPIIIPIGALIGFLVAAPIGPVNLLCIKRTIERGFFGSFPAVLGAVLGDGLIALFAALGVGSISGAVQNHRFGIQIIGGFALIYLGVKLLINSPQIFAQSQLPNFNSSLKDFACDIPLTFF